MNSTISHSDSRQVLGKVAAAVALGAVVGSRVRPGGVLLFAGAAAWAALRKRPQRDTEPQPPSVVETPTSSPDTLTEVCPPSEPFITKGTSDSPPANWEELREALIPPPNLFTPPPKSKPTSPLLAAAPQFITTPEPPSGSTPSPSEAKAVIPDTISIPDTSAWSNQFKTNPLLGSQPSPPIFPNQN